VTVGGIARHTAHHKENGGREPVRLAQPPGVRSCRDGGKWDFCRNAASGGNYVMVEIGKLENALAPADGQLIRQELLVKMRRAEDGVLDYGSGAVGGDVELMGIAPTVLELRLSSRPGEYGALLLRLYFTEPEGHERLLLALKLAWKRPGPLGLAEQNGHARTAARRADEHLASM
jgi:hypothetical protein